MTGDRFEELTRKMGSATSRRSVLRGMGAAVVGGVAATVLKPFRADAACPAGTSVCGSACCPAGAACTNRAKSCCCAKGETPCNNACCKAGVACADLANSVCGCPKGTTPCGSGTTLKCCNKGTACTPSNATCQPVSTFATASSTCCKDVGASCVGNSECCSNFCLSGFCQ